MTSSRGFFLCTSGLLALSSLSAACGNDTTSSSDPGKPGAVSALPVMISTDAGAGNTAECPASATTITAHLQTTSSALLASAATACVNGSCQPLSLTTADTGAAIVDWGDGWQTVAWHPEPALLPGDTYRLAITDANGASLIDVTQTVGPPPQFPDDEPSTGGAAAIVCPGDTTSFDVYATSQQDQTCTGFGYPSLVTLEGDLGGVPVSTATTLTVCRNSECATAPALERTEGPAYAQTVAAPRMSFIVEVVYDAQDGTTGGPYEVYFEATPPEQLSDGDLYSVQLDDGAVYRRSGAAAYASSFPQGMACEAMPFKSAALHL